MTRHQCENIEDRSKPSCMAPERIARHRNVVRRYVDTALLKSDNPRIRRAIIKGAFSVIRREGLARLERYTLELQSAGW